MKVMVTGGSGFIGSAVVLHLLENAGCEVLNFDGLTYAANPCSLAPVEQHPRYHFAHGDIGDAARLNEVFRAFRPDAVMHLAAESHVDRSIDGPRAFMDTNVMGVFTLLQAARQYHGTLAGPAREAFRFHHVSTDEVYGALGETGRFTEETPYAPNSPYAASKAASDHLVRAWGRTYGLPVLLSNCSNNYGPRQFPEKLIPLIILNALAGRELPVYGRGQNVRDWLYVEDHARALLLVLTRGRPGEQYNIGGHNEIANIEVVRQICALLDEFKPRGRGSYAELITFVPDRPGHDFRYAIEAGKIERELGWRPLETFAGGLRRTVRWYLDNEAWWRAVRPEGYQHRRGLAAQQFSK